MKLLTTKDQLLGLSPSTNLRKAIESLRQGLPVLLVDSAQREDEGDLVVAAELITAKSMNFLIKKGSGLVCLALPQSRIDELNLPLMVPGGNSSKAAFTISIDAKNGITTGISAEDRAHTIQVAMAENSASSQLESPGHVFPLAAKNRGVFERMGHTEGSVDLMRIAGLKPGAVLCELLNENGSIPKNFERYQFAKEYDIPIVSIEDILLYRTAWLASKATP